MDTSLLQSWLLGSLVFITTCGVLLMVIIFHREKIRSLKESITKLNRSFEIVDEQAKLIIKTDLDLNKAQEELDKRLLGLDALQKTSRLISTTLDENEIFHRLKQSLIIDLNFEKSLIFIYDEQKKLKNQINLGFSKEETDKITYEFQNNHTLIQWLKEGHLLSSLIASKPKKEAVTKIINLNQYVLTPILTQNGLIGIFLVGYQSPHLMIAKSDEEVVSILSNQIGQSIENARLFEQAFRSRQDLEVKVHDRTSELEDTLLKLTNISKAKSEFISAVSHELRTPLTSIKGYASILMTDKLGAVPEEVKTRLQKINTHSDNLVNLINELLDIARIESGKAEMNFTPNSILKIIENISDLLTPQMKNKNIKFTTNIAANVPLIIIDLSQVERVFINLISNAIKFVPAETGVIVIKASLHESMVHVEVTDNGIGISESDVDKLFDEFYRVENSINQNVKGTGLGLSLAKKIVEAHKGRIWVTSKIGQGTTFHFTLPIQQQKV